jgi:diguanylate cyclase (GGDEF)-like protein/PAS domain S-box-containing protein
MADLERSASDREEVSHRVLENFRYAVNASIAGVFNAFVACVALLPASLQTPLIFWMIAVLVGAAMRIILIRKSDTISKDVQGWNKRKNYVEWIAFFNGSVWGMGVLVLQAYGGQAGLWLAVLLGSGMMGASVTIYTSLARASILFLSPLALACIIMLWKIPEVPIISGSLLLFCYYLLLAKGSLDREGRFIQRIKAQESVRESAATVKLLLNDFEAQTSDWLWQVDEHGNVEGASNRFAEASGLNESLLNQYPIVDLFKDSPERKQLQDHIRDHHGFRNLTLQMTVDGSPHWWTLSAQPMDNGGMRGVASDVTAQKRAEARVSYMAHYDGLTDLANRFLFNDTLQHHLNRLHEDEQLAVIYLDLDRFKSVNDSLGHTVGDKLLCVAARRLEKCLLEDDMVARLGGDEFAILLRGQNLQQRTHKVCTDIIEALREPAQIEGLQVVTSASLGIAYSEGRDTDSTDMMKRADLALYAAKAAGRDRLAEFEEGMDKAAEERLNMEIALRVALAENQFEIFYQPLIDIATGDAVAYEALIRWTHPEHGLIKPDEFIPLAEETGLIVPIGEWVIRNVCDEIANWPEHICVSVNLSPAQMRSPNLISCIIGAIAHADIDPARLELEITENVFLNNSETNLAILHSLRKFGVRIALDDFGTGYSSLNYLRSFPFDKIKIDRSFISDINENDDCKAIVRAVTGLATSLGMETTAEGVEQHAQLDTLRLEGCTQAQGYLFAHPERSKEFTNLRPETVDIPTAKLPRVHKLEPKKLTGNGRGQKDEGYIRSTAQ